MNAATPCDVRGTVCSVRCIWTLGAFGCHCPSTVALVASSNHAEEWVNWIDALFGISGKGKAANACIMRSLTEKHPFFEVQFSSWSPVQFILENSFRQFLPISGFSTALSLAKRCCRTCYSPLKFKVAIFSLDVHSSPLEVIDKWGENGYKWSV